MIFTIENNDVFRFQIISLPSDFDDLVEKDLISITQKPLLYCLRLSPFKREEVWNLYKDTIINDIITKFKALKENEEVK